MTTHNDCCAYESDASVCRISARLKFEIYKTWAGFVKSHLNFSFMSGPYVYTPSAPPYRDLGPSPYLSQFHNRQRVSPHIPFVNLADPSAPNTPIRSSTILDEDPWTPPRTRSRRPSWHAGMSTPFLTAPSLTVPTDYTHTRRRSFGASASDRSYSASAPWMVPGTPAPSVPGFLPAYPYGSYPPVVPSELHPLLRPDIHAIYFDLSFFEFRPVDAKGIPISGQTLAEPATHPPTTRLVVASDVIPQWPVLLDYHAATLGTSHPSSVLPPITLGDVLYAVHQTLHSQITHKEWAELDEREGTAVAKAYVRRYKLAAGHESRIATEGVKRVDYLLKKVMFAGLSRKNGDQGYENLKLLVKNR